MREGVGGREGLGGREGGREGAGRERERQTDRQTGTLTLRKREHLIYKIADRTRFPNLRSKNIMVNLIETPKNHLKVISMGKRSLLIKREYKT